MSVFSRLSIFYRTKIKKQSIYAIRNEKYRRSGATIGKDVYIFSEALGSEPYLVTIGDNVIISAGCKVLTHDASAAFYLDNATNLYGKVSIGNRCFIGTNSIILPGVSIADGCIVGAGSVVTKSIAQPNTVIAGNPAKMICTTDDLRERNRQYGFYAWNLTLDELKECLKENQDRLIRR